MASAPVIIAGKASGTAATAKLIAHRTISGIGRPTTTPAIATLMAMITARRPIHLPTLPMRFSSGVFS